MKIKKTLAVIFTAGFLFSHSGLYASSIIYALNPDPVSSAMADSGVALISNVMTGTVINPASTVGIYRTVASVGGSNMTGDIQYNFGSIGFATSIGIFGASLMYVDYNTLQNAAIQNGLKCELILEGEHYDYLARLFN